MSEATEFVYDLMPLGKWVTPKEMADLLNYPHGGGFSLNLATARMMRYHLEKLHKDNRIQWRDAGWGWFHKYQYMNDGIPF